MEISESNFTKLAKDYKATIYTVCYMFSKDQDEVSDLFQEVLINLWKGFERFDGRSEIRTWIYRVALNTCISAARKKRKIKHVPLDMNLNLFADDGEKGNRQVKILHERISKLQPFDRAIILLWLENMSYEEIGMVV